MLSFGAVGKFFRLLRKKSGNAFILKFSFHAAANFFKGWRGRWFDRSHFVYDHSLRQLYLVRRRLLTLFKGSIHELGRVANAGKRFGAADEISAYHLKVARGRGFIEAGSARLRQ